LGALLAGCASGRRSGRDTPPAIPVSIADSIRTERVAPRVWLHHLVRNTGPLRAHVLDIDRSACVSFRAHRRR